MPGEAAPTTTGPELLRLLESLGRRHPRLYTYLSAAMAALNVEAPAEGRTAAMALWELIDTLPALIPSVPGMPVDAPPSLTRWVDGGDDDDHGRPSDALVAIRALRFWFYRCARNDADTRRPEDFAAMVAALAEWLRDNADGWRDRPGG